jgi:hypothetical protein
VTHVYVTDDLMPNPWDTLPRYWSAELSELGSSPGGGPLHRTTAPSA